MSLETTVSGTRPNVFLSDVRVYIAGVLMPVTHVTVRSGAGQMPEASISLPPCPDLFVVGRMDRIPVHIFDQGECRRQRTTHPAVRRSHCLKTIPLSCVPERNQRVRSILGSNFGRCQAGIHDHT